MNYKVGDKIRSKSTGREYLVIRIDGKKIFAHRNGDSGNFIFFEGEVE